jgi:hypothetical protein
MCIKASVAALDGRGRRPFAYLLLPALALASTLLAWAAIFSLGQIIMESVTLAERSAWRDR